MHILFNGDSYTWGDELLYRLRDRFSNIVSKHYNATSNNISICGNSNDAIARTTMEWFAHNQKCDLAVIQFAPMSRFEGWNPDKKKYYHVTIQKSSGWDEFYKEFYQEKLAADNLFKNYFLLEQFFIARKIKYVFMLHDAWDRHLVESSNIWKSMLVQKPVYYIRGHDFIDRVIIPEKDKNELIVSNGNHPNELGHQKIAQHIIDTIGTLQ
jgi:hypothetical protein